MDPTMKCSQDIPAIGGLVKKGKKITKGRSFIGGQGAIIH